uniref:Type VI secretion system ATPase TssH n=1 Tax=Eiseniibacteriota bacterium TaxID=2212470 RepID=A0A832I5L0_UNCEI
MDVELKALFRKLNRTVTRAIEGAAGLCISRGHYEVTVEHLLLVLLDDPNADVQPVLNHFGVNVAGLMRDLQRTLEKQRTGNTGRPVFSPILLQWIQDAWLLASVEFGDQHLRSGVMLVALVRRPDRYTAEDLSSYFEPVRRDELKRDLAAIAGSSREAVDAASDAAAAGAGGAAAAAPGAPATDSAIARFMIDFTAKARAGEIDPVFGRDREIRQMIDILARRRKNNPIVVGEPGVGKTAVVEGLALRIVQGDVPDVLKNVKLLSLDLGLLQAGASVKGEFENRLKNVIAEVKASPTPIVTFIDEAHTLIGAGGAAGTSDAANLLKPALARGELRTVAATTWAEYKKYFEKDAALERRFQLVKLDEPSEADAIVMMRGLRDRYEQAHGVRILDEAVQAAARLSSRYISGRQLPDKAVDLLDTAAARVKIGRATKPEAVDDLERRIGSLERERAALEGDARMGRAADPERLAQLAAEIASLTASRDALVARFERERAALERVLALRAKLEPGAPGAPQAAAAAAGEAPAEGATAPLGEAERAALSRELDAALAEFAALQGDDPLVPLDVDGRLVAQVVAGWTGIPVGKMMKDEAAAMLTFKERLAERIKGQDQAIEAVDRGLRAARAGLKNPGAPIGQFLFVGPSGVGKTETATAVADLMFGGERFLTSINMSEFQEKHTVSRLLGSPPGYVGYGEGGVLTEAIRQRPYSVVLLDEVEKADPEVLNVFYQVFDKGTVSDGTGRVIDCKNCVFFLTSNLATDILTQMSTGPVRPTREELIAAIRPVLSRHFKPALLARMEIVPFYTLPPEFLKEITKLKLKKIANRLMDSHKMTLECDPAMVDLIAARCTEVETGARNIDHILSETLLPMMSSALLQKMAEGPLPDTLRVKVGAGETFELEFASTR